MNRLTLFDHLKLASSYPTKDYGKEINRVISFLIARNNSTTSIVDYIRDKILPKFKERLNYRDPSVRHVTALHLAVMKERLDLIRALCELGADPNVVDDGGWSPYHLTALIADSVAMREIFEKYHIQKDLKTKAGDSYDDLRIQTGYVAQNWGMGKTFIEQPDGQLVSLTETGLSNIGLKSYTDSIIFLPDTYPFLWKKEQYGVDNLTSDYEELFANLPTKAPKVIIALDNEISKSSGKKCFGLKAGEDIALGTPVCMYAGTIIPQRKSNFFAELQNREPSDEYDIGFQQDMAIQPFTNGNAARFINDGLPNVSLRFIPGKGLMALALQDIKAGEFFHFNYEKQHRLKWMGSFLKNKESLRCFFKQFPLKELFTRLSSYPPKPSEASRRERIEDKRIRALTAFALWTPSAILYLSLTNTVTAKEWLDIFDNSELFESVKVNLLKNDFVHICWLVSMLEELRKFEESIKKVEVSDPNAALEIRNFLISLLDSKDIPKILFSLNIFGVAYPQMDVDVNTYIKNLSKTIDSYSWKDSHIQLLPGYTIDSNGQMGIVITPRFQALYLKYGIIKKSMLSD
jgi:hypothetical protein